jgi:hypothetical protein
LLIIRTEPNAEIPEERPDFPAKANEQQLQSKQFGAGEGASHAGIIYGLRRQSAAATALLEWATTVEVSTRVRSKKAVSHYATLDCGDMIAALASR